MPQIILLSLLTFAASLIGTAIGFGTSTFMVPVMTLFVPIPTALLFVGIIHLCGDIWKIILFRTGFDWKLVLGFGLPGMGASLAGASLALAATDDLPLKKSLAPF